MYIQESFAEEEFIKQIYKIYEETMHYEQEPEDTVSWKIRNVPLPKEFQIILL